MKVFNPAYIEAGHKGKAIVVTIGLVALLLCSVYVSYRAARSRGDRSLFLEAKRGDLSSLAQLEARGADEYIKFLAEDRTAPVVVRSAALDTLKRRPTKSSGVVALMLWIKEPLVIRERAVDYFKTRGCDDTCTSATLRSLRSIRQGEAMLEESEEPKTAPTPQLLKESQERTKMIVNQTLGDYVELLRRDPCLTYTVAREDGLTTDRQFMRRLEPAIGPCTGKH